jgi:carboxymethylenebutenolidase
MSEPSIETGYVDYQPGARAFYAKPKGARDLPCAIMLHERYGLVPHAIHLTERLAGDGYVTLAPNLYYRHPDQAALNAGKEWYRPRDVEVAADLHAAVGALAKLGGADRKRLAVIGSCQTGRHPIVYAAQHEAAAIVTFYGAREWDKSERFPVALPELVERIRCPFLGIFGEGDHGVSVANVRRLRDAMEKSGKSHAIHILREAPHGFLNHTMPGRFRREATEISWAIMLAFLREALAPGVPGAHKNRVTSLFASDIAVDYDFTKNKRYSFSKEPDKVATRAPRD